MTYCQKSSQKKSFRWPHTEIWRISSLGCLHDLWLVFGSCGQRFHSVWSIGCHLLRLVREPTTCDYRPSPVITGWTAGIPHGYRLRPGVVGWARHRSWITTRLMKIYQMDELQVPSHKREHWMPRVCVEICIVNVEGTKKSQDTHTKDCNTMWWLGLTNPKTTAVQPDQLDSIFFGQRLTTTNPDLECHAAQAAHLVTRNRRSRAHESQPQNKVVPAGSKRRTRPLVLSFPSVLAGAR